MFELFICIAASLGAGVTAGLARISTATGGWMLADSSRLFSFLFCTPQDTSATPSTSSAAQRAILPTTSVEI